MSGHIVSGLVGGLVGAVGLIAIAFPYLKHGPAGPASLARVVGGKKGATNPVLVLLLGAAYGAAAGLVFAILFQTMVADIEYAARDKLMLWGIVYGAALWGGMFAWAKRAGGKGTGVATFAGVGGHVLMGIIWAFIVFQMNAAEYSY